MIIFFNFLFDNTHTNRTYYTLQNPLPFPPPQPLPPFAPDRDQTNFNTKQYRAIFIMNRIHIFNDLMLPESVLRFTVPRKQGSEVYEFQVNPF